jgi:indole-3-glycerol phosphate synthase
MRAKSVLDHIVSAVEARLRDVAPLPDLEQRARDAADRRRNNGLRSLAEALRNTAPAVIAECKKASPSVGLLRSDFDPAALARAYEEAGAAAISVVTEADFFRGEIRWLSRVRDEVHLPVIRKDFIVSERQLMETAVEGADAVLLIQRILEPERLTRLMDLAEKLSLEVLLEVFADEDPATAVDSGAPIIGVNARDLTSFTTRLDRVETLIAAIPSDRVRVAESGISCRADVQRLHRAGYDAFLIGEALVRADDPADTLRQLTGRPIDTRLPVADHEDIER